jgi:hypothetical protein
MVSVDALTDEEDPEIAYGRSSLAAAQEAAANSSALNNAVAKAVGSAATSDAAPSVRGMSLKGGGGRAARPTGKKAKVGIVARALDESD